MKSSPRALFLCPDWPQSSQLQVSLIRGYKAQAELTLLNIKRVLEAAGTDLDHIVKCSVYLKDINDFAAMNEVYERFFPHESKRPARVTVQAVLGSNIKIEIDAIAELPE